MIRWGIVGLGNMANHFANATKEMENVELKAIASQSNSKLNNFSEKFNIDKKYSFKSYDELINCDEIDALYIATLNNSHLELILKSAEAKKNILCEKPIGLNHNEAKEAYKAITENKINFYEAIAYYSHPQKYEIKKIIENNEIGEIQEIKSSFGFKSRFNPSSRLYNKNLGGGAILDVGCYPISFLMLFVNELSDFKFLKKNIIHAKSGVDQTATAKISLKEKINVEIKVSICENYENNSVITGSKGSVIIPEPWIPNKKSYMDISHNNNFYKKFINSNLSTYAYQIKMVSNAFLNKSTSDENLFNINKSLLCSNLLDQWKIIN